MLGALTIPAFIALCAALSALTFAGLSLGISTAPGWRSLRWYAFAAVLSALFTAGDAITSLSVPTHWYAWFARFNMFLAGLHGACWFFFDAAQRGRSLARWERVVVGVALVAAVMSLVPGLMVTDHLVAREVPWLALTYRDVVPTPLGGAVSMYYVVALAVLAVRTLRDPGPNGRALGVALLVLAATALHDTLVFSFALAAPYLLSVGILAVIVGVGVSVVARFVQNARALEEALGALRDTREVLVRQERPAALGEMSAMVATGVRTPLGLIFNALAMVRRGPLDAQQAILLQIIDEESWRLRRLVTDLLDFSRPGVLRRSPVEAVALVAAAVDAARAGVADLSPMPTVSQSVPPTIAPVRVDAEFLRRALINLVDNALRAPGCRAVHVSARDDGDALLLCVSDDGDGVEEALREKVFAPFYSSRPSGTGLGLAIVRNAARVHGGTVAYSETEGGGATFTLRIPRA